MHQINGICKCLVATTEQAEGRAPHVGCRRRERSFSHGERSPRRHLAVVVVIGTLIGAAATVGGAERGPRPVSERVRYEAAALALDQGDERLSVQLLEELADDTSSDRARSLYRALIARAEGRLDRVDEIFRNMPLAPPGELGGEYAWVETPLAVLAAERELDRIRRENEDRLDQILSQHYEARGGLEKLLSLTDLLANGHQGVGAQEFPFQQARKRDRFYRFDLQTPGGLRVEAFDGDVAWEFDSPRGETQAAYLPESRMTEFKRLAFFDEVLVRFKTTGEQLFLKDTETVDGREYYPIDVSAGGQLLETIYLDSETLLEARRLIWNVDGSLLAERVFEHKDVDGISLPATQTIWVEESAVTYRYDQCTLDVEIPVRVFVLSEFNDGLSERSPAPIGTLP